MEEYKKKEVGLTCLMKARSYAVIKDWSRAFPHYLMCLELFPNEKTHCEHEFAEVVYEYSIWLENQKRFDEIYKWYTKSLEYFPSNSQMLNNFAETLLRFGKPESALVILNRAYEINHKSLLLERNILTAKLDIVPRWHYRMLNDVNRNKAYRNAIHNAITPKYNKVLEIGSGCGILSYYASECKNTEQIIAIEVSKTLAEISANALKNVHCNLKICNCCSTDLHLNDIDLSNLLIFEIFDAALFGEHVLETVIHAWEHLLKPDAKVIPANADLFVTGFSNKAILSQHKLCFDIPELNLSNVCLTKLSDEPYNAENLKQKKVAYLTDTWKVLTVDFNNIEQLKSVYTDSKVIPTFKLTALKDGCLDGFVVWFDLHLDENNRITTNPLRDSVTCWEQAVIYLDHSQYLKAGQSVDLQLSCAMNKMEIKLVNSSPQCVQCYKTSPEVITFLNDRQIIESALDIRLPKINKNTKIFVLDYSPVSVYSLCLAKKGYKGHYKILVRVPEDVIFFNYMWSVNGFHLNEIDGDVTVEFCDAEQMSHFLKENKADVIFINPISQNGTLSEETFHKLTEITEGLKSDGYLFPEIRLCAEVIDSAYLDYCNKVDDKNLLGFKVAEEMNKYSVLEHWEVEPQYYDRKTLLNTFTIFIKLSSNYSRTLTETITIPLDGVVNGIIYWFEMSYSNKICISTYKSLHFKGACFMFQNPQCVQKGETINLTFKQTGPLMKIFKNGHEVELIT